MCLYFVKWFIFIWQIFFAFYFAVNKSISTNAKVLTRKWNSCLELNLSLPEYFNWFPFRELWQKTLKLLAKIENTTAIGLVWTYSPKTGLEHLLKNKHKPGYTKNIKPLCNNLITEKVNKQKFVVKIQDLYCLFVWAERDISFDF